MTTQTLNISKLKELLPSIEKAHGNLKQKTGTELAGPCPKCGGIDRFCVFPLESRFMCRFCNWTGDIIDFHTHREGTDLQGLFKMYLPEAIKNVKNEKTETKKTPEEVLQIWNDIPVPSDDDREQSLSFLNGERKISVKIIDQAIQDMKIKIYQYPLSCEVLNSCYNDYKGNDAGKCVAIPFHDAEGNLISIQYISITGRALNKSGATKLFEKNTNVRDAFFIYNTPAETVVIVESVMNALSIIDTLQGKVCAIALGGASLTKKLNHLKKQFKGKKIVCFFDHDEAGERATNAAAKALHGLEVHTTVWAEGTPDKYDVNDLLKDGQREAIIEMVNKAEPVRVEERKKIVDDKEIEKLNVDYAIVLVSGKCLILRESINPVSGKPDLNFMSPTDFRTFFANKFAYDPVSKKSENLAEAWLTSPMRREYQGIVFKPGAANLPHFYNLWKGFAVEPKKGDWAPFMMHIYNVIAKKNEDRFKYILAWMARIVQDPGGDKPGTCIALRGKQGIGKSFLWTMYGQVFGKHFIHITNQSQLVGRFNNILKDALFVFVDEGFWAGDRSAEGVLKGLITENYHVIEPKGKDPFQVENHINLAMASNNSWIVPAALEERRFFVVDVADTYMKDSGYFRGLANCLLNEGLQAMLYDLLEYDISSIDLRVFPRTEALFDQILSSLDSVGKYWFETLRAGTMDSDGYWPSWVVTSKFYEDYLDFAKTAGNRFPVADRQFTKQLKQYCPGIPGDIESNIRRTRKNVETKPLWVLELPSLESCRAQFESIVQMKIDWAD
jgi:phage/plasmid primase-like uncharacterized protein